MKKLTKKEKKTDNINEDPDETPQNIVWNLPFDIFDGDKQKVINCRLITYDSTIRIDIEGSKKGRNRIYLNVYNGKIRAEQ